MGVESRFSPEQRRHIVLSLLKGRVPGTRLRMDNLRAYASDHVVDTAKLLGFAPEFIHNQVPEDNGCVESFHAGLDRDYLRHLVFDSFQEAAADLEKAWIDYNTVKPMKRLGWKTPREYRESFQQKLVHEVVANVK